MTTFQDLPPQSRRAVRQSERDGDTSSQVASGSLPTAQPFLPAPAATAEGQQPAPQQPAAPPASGRRSRAAAPSGLVDMPTTPPTGYPAPEPLTYTTQATPAFQQQQPAPAPAQPATEQQASEQYSAEQQAYRVRDFSPEGRRAAQTGAPQQPAAAPLDYRTQAGPPPASPAPTSPPVAGPTATNPPVAGPTATTPPVAGPTATTPPVAGPTATTPPVAGPTASTPPVAAAAPVSAAPPVAPVVPTQTTPPVAPPTSRRSAGAAPQQTSPDLPTQTLSRRELRALQAEQDAAAALTSGTYEVPPLVEPVAAPPSNLSNAMAEFEALTRASQAAQQATAAQQVPAAAEQSATASQPDLFGAARAEQARIEQAERARAQQAADNQAAENQAAESLTAENQAAESQAAQQQAAQEAEQARARFEHDERARAEAEARAQQATQAEAAQLAQAHAARAREEAAQAAQQQAQQHADQQRAEHETAQQRAREAAAAAQATAQAEANARALAESQQQAEILARREWDAQQAQQAAAQQAAAGPAAQQSPAQPGNPFDALLGGASAPSATNPPASDPLTALFVEPIEQTGSHATSTGHWSQQAQIEDDEQPFENTLSRDVGGGNVATTTSALVLPVMPTADFGGIISGTGEILVTGSIELPRSLGTTGGDSRRYDDPDVDNLFDAFDNEIISTDSAPVRAIRAVSTHTSTHGVITTANKPHGNRLLLAALIAIPVLIVGIAGLLIAAFSSGMF